MNAKRVISDPVSHAETTCGGRYAAAGTVFPARPYAAFCTTGQFASLDNGYVRHCGPTAITNFLLLLQKRDGLIPASRSPEDIFRTVTAVGRQRLVYLNRDLFHLYGGTNNLRTGNYLSACLKAYGIPCHLLNVLGNHPVEQDGSLHLALRVPACPDTMKRELLLGRTLYLVLHHHRCYGNHHVLCYGYQELAEVSSGRKLTYFLIADGWSAAPRFLAASELGFCSCWSVF